MGFIASLRGPMSILSGLNFSLASMLCFPDSGPKKIALQSHQNLPLDDRRAMYKCKERYVTLESLSTWSVFLQYQLRFASFKFKEKSGNNYAWIYYVSLSLMQPAAIVFLANL